MQQQAALEVLAAGQQAAGVPTDPEDLTLDVLQHLGGQHDLVAAYCGTLQEVHRDLPSRAEHLEPEADHLPAEHAPLAGERPDLAEDGLDPVLIRAGDLDHHLGPRAAVDGLQHDGQPGPATIEGAVIHQVDAVADAGMGLPAGTGGNGDGQHAADTGRAERAVVGGLEEVADPDDLHVAHHPDTGDAEHLVRALAARLQPGLQADLDVDVLVGRPGGRHRGQGGRVRTQVVQQELAQRLVVGPGGPHRSVQQASGQAPDVGEFRAIGRIRIRHGQQPRIR